MKYEQLTLLFIVTILLMIVSVSADLGSFKQNTCVNIRVLNNCTANTIVEVSSNNQTFVLNKPMTNLGGQTFNYSFCNTSFIDTYSYSWNPNCYDCSTGNCGNSFSITLSGDNPTTGEAIIEFILFIGLLIVIILTLIGAIIFPWENNENEEGKIIGINDLKYVKIVLWFFAYLEGIFMVMVLKNISGFMNADGIYNALTIIFNILLVLVFPIFCLIILFTIIIWLSDKKLDKKLKMGVFQ